MAWTPKLSISEVDKLITAPGSIHELETVYIEGRGVYRVYKKLYPSLRVFWLWAANEHKSKIYVTFEGQSITFAEIFAESLKAAALFKDVYGIQKGDRVAICSRNYPSWLTAFWASQLIGAVCVLVNAWLPMTGLSFCFTHTQSKLVILDAERADLLEGSVSELSGVNKFLVLGSWEKPGRNWKGMQTWEDALASYRGDPRSILKNDPPITPEDNATIMFTSGTTGLPKGVLSTQRMFLTNVLNALAGTGRATLRRGETPAPAAPDGPQKAVLVSVPLFHATGVTSLSMLATLTGMKIVLMRKWSQAEAAKLIMKENVTLAGGVPTMVTELIESGISKKQLEGLLFGGSPAPSNLPAGAKAAFPSTNVSQAYGLTETNSVAVSITAEDYCARPTSAGLPTPVNDLLIVKDGKVMPPGQSGEVWIRGPNVMKCYWGDPEATARALTVDGWLRSGDLGVIDEEGFLYILDRLKDMIIRGGENIDSTSVENALYASPDVVEAAAVGVPDKKMGELVAAVVVVRQSRRDEVTEQSLIALARERLAKFAVPVMIVIQYEPFEKTATGKVLKQKLRELAIKEWKKRENIAAKL